MKLHLIRIWMIVWFIPISIFAQADLQPLRVGVHGLTHSHVHGLLRSLDKGDIELVGIAESNRELALRYARRYEIPESLLFDDLEIMLNQTRPEAVLAFNSIYGHLETVEACAPLGIHVMVEKPLTYRKDHLAKMLSLVEKYKIMLLTNYETTWYPSIHETFRLVHEEDAIGRIRKIVVMDGHPGPQEIGVNPEFLEWLTDPQGDGAGALVDFGCYGANLATWLMKGQRPESVTAVVQQIKPDIYPQVDDEASIVLTYPGAQVIIQASWNWPFHRKDMEVYGQTGMIYQKNKHEFEIRLKGTASRELKIIPDRTYPFNNPFVYFAAAIRGRIEIPENSLSSLENNQIVVEILDAAIQSAKEGKTIRWKSD